MDLLTPSEQQRLDDDGYLVLEGIVQPNHVKAMRDRLEELLLITEQEHRGTLIVGGLLEEEVFDAAWLHPRVLAAVRHGLGDAFRLTGAIARGIRPGHGQQAIHADWSDGLGGEPGVWYGCHAICPLVDFTKDNGATRVVPGSHRNPRMLKTRHGPHKTHPAERQLIGPAGTVFVVNIHCGHSAVHNASNEPRHAIFTGFSRRDSPVLSLNASSVVDPSPKILARFDAAVQAVLKG
jgi:ectoine hydroxylase-related dioxygenase (phytanoyl-CoA dioxygenase family)